MMASRKQLFETLEDDYMKWRFIRKKVHPYKLPHLNYYKRYTFDSYHRWQNVVDRGDLFRYVVRQLRRMEREFIKKTNLDVLPMAAMRYNSPYHIQEFEIWQDTARDQKILPKDMNMAYIRRDMDAIRDENFREITPCMYEAFREFRNIMVNIINPSSFYYNEIWPLFNKNLLDVMDEICDPVSQARVNYLLKKYRKYVKNIRKIIEQLKIEIDAKKCKSDISVECDPRLASRENLIKKFDKLGINIPRFLEFPYCNYVRYGYRLPQDLLRVDEKQNCHIVHLEAPGLRADMCATKPTKLSRIPRPSDSKELYFNPCDDQCLTGESYSDETSEQSKNDLCLEIHNDRSKFDNINSLYINEAFWKLLWPERGCSLDDADTLSEICKLRRYLEPGTCMADCECESCERLMENEKPIRRRILGLRPLSKKKAIETKLIHSLITGNLEKTDREEELQTDHIVKGKLVYKSAVDEPPNEDKFLFEIDKLKFSELLLTLLGQWIELGIIGDKKLPLVKVKKPAERFPLIHVRTGDDEDEKEEDGIEVKEYRIPYVEFILKEVMGDKEPGEILKAVVNKHLRRSKEEIKKNLATKNLSFSLDYLLKPFTYCKGVLKENPKLWKTCNKGKVYKTNDDIKQLAKYLLVNLIKQQLTEPDIEKSYERCDPELVDFAECLLNIFNEYFKDLEFYHRGDDEDTLIEPETDEVPVKARCKDENKVFESLINCLINHLSVREILDDIFGEYKERTKKFELLQVFEENDKEFCKLIAPIIRALKGFDEKSADEEEEAEKQIKKKKIKTKEWTKLIQIVQDILVRTKKLLNHVKIFKVEQLLDYSKAHKNYKLDCDLVSKEFNHSNELNDLKKGIKLILTRIKVFFKILFAIETREVKIGLSNFFVNLVEKEKGKTIDLKEITKLLITKLRKIVKMLNNYEKRTEKKGFNMYRFVYYLDNTKDNIKGIHEICKLILENLVNDKPLSIRKLKIILETKATAEKFRRKFELIPGYERGLRTHEEDEGIRDENYAIEEEYGRYYLSDDEDSFEANKRKYTKKTIKRRYMPKPGRRKMPRKPVFWNDMLLFMTKVQYSKRNVDTQQLDSRNTEKSDEKFQQIIFRKLMNKTINENTKYEQFNNEEMKKHKLTKLKVKRTIIDKNNNKKELSKTIIKHETMVTSKSPEFSRYQLSDSDTNPFEDGIEFKNLRTQFKQIRLRNELENEMTRYCSKLRNM